MKPMSSSLVRLASIALFVFSSAGLCSASVFILDSDAQDLIFDRVDGYDRVKMVEAGFSAEPGTPLLPVKFVQIAIPVDLEVERVEVISFEYQELPGTYRIYPAQPFYPLSSLPTEEENIEFVEPGPSVYQSSSEYPGELAQVTNNGFLGGQHIAGVALYPLQYIPAQGRLVLYTQIEFELVFQPSSHSPAPINRRSERGARFYSDLAKSMVINPEAVQVEAKGSLPPEEEADYLIITDGSFVATFQELADWKIQKGISTEIREVSWVLSNYPGYDDPEKIRNCIRDFYSNHGTKWVLLGGDTPILPHRIAPVMNENIPCDLYFSDLDSNWDANGNHVYGEYEDAIDMYPDVFVGRAPSSDISQAQTLVNKCLTYEIDPPTDYQAKILYAAEVLWPGTDAAELKNYIDSSFVPDHFQATKLYETSGNLNSITFRDSLNQGQNIINHNGHGDYNALSLGSDSWFSSDMDDLTNAPRFSLFYTFGCITAAIDMDCIAEHFVNNPDGGGFAYCGNTRFGWGVPGAPLEGPGPEFDIEFFRALFDSANYQVGKTLGNSKLPFIPISQEPSGHGPYYRWTMFTLLLLGDPTLELWTDTPAELSVSHDPIFLAGLSYFEVNVVEDSALVSCVKDGQILGTSYSSGGSAMVYFDSALVTMGTMHVTVTKHDYMPFHDTVLVIPPEGPYLIYHSHEIDDSQGNNNGVVNPDETILMSITVKNIGIETAYGVSATLREEDDYILVTDSVKNFGDIDSGMTAQSLDDYVFEVDPSCPDSHLVEFSLEATDGETSWASSFSQMVVEPDFVITAIPDTAVVHQGDSTSIKLILQSVGGFDWQVDLTHTALPPEVSGFLDPDQLIPTDSSIFRIYAMEEAYPGVHSITITATGGGITREKEVVLGILPPPYYGPVWYVSTEGNDLIGNGSPEFPFRTIQKGIQTAADGDTVLAAPGTYNEHINFDGKALLVTSQAGAESTIISKLYDDLPIVTFDSGEDSNSVLDGFTIQNANNPDGYGGAIQCYDHSSPTIRNNVLKDNVAGSGAGVDVWFYCSPIIENNRIIGNSASGSGGGIRCYDQSSPTIRQNLFIENSAFWMGGGASCRYYCSPTISENWFIQNSAGNDGGGIYCREFSSPIISQNLFIENSAGKAGGALYCFDSSSPLIISNTFDRNTSNEWGGSITCHSGSSPDIRNTIVSSELIGYGIYAEDGSFPTITYCDVWNNASGNFSGCTPGEGCISADPIFCHPQSDNYYLHSLSPCLGAGQDGADIGALGLGCGVGPYVVYHSHQIDDSQGNNNGVVNPDETILMSITVKNIGIETAYGVSATLREEDDYILVTDSVKSFGDIDSGMTAQSLDDYVFEVDPSCPDSHLVEFSLEATDGETSWVSSFSQMVVEPDFVITAIPDTAVVHQGDSTSIKLILQSVGGFNWQVDLTHTALPPEVSGFLDPDQLIPTDSSVFRMYATEEAYPGVHSITITATGGEIIREKEVTLAILPPGYYGPVWYVSTEGDDSTGNGSPEFPFRTIQKGIQTATDGDTVLAAPGTYNEHVNFDGKALLVTSQAGAESTIISKLYDDLPIVTFDSGEDSNSVLDGFTIQNANNPDGYGGAIQCYDHSSPTIRNNILKDNVAGSGAGVDIRSGCSPIIENNRIIGNSSSGSGGGIHCYGQSSPTIRQNLFIENSAFWMGGGISCRHYCSPPISENWFIQNSAGNDGGGLYCRDSSSPIISQNLFIQNYAGKAGGAVYCFQSSSPVILANTLDRNTSNEWGGSITCHSSSSPEIRNTIVSNELVGYGIYAEEGSYPTITYCDVWNNASGNFSGCTPGDGCISDDPVFCDPENGNYYLQNTSPCLGAGQGGSDIGALPAGCTRGDVNGDGTIDIADITYLINYLFIDGSAPDPSWVGDANSDGVVDVADVAYLINYLFIDGPPPCGPQVLPAFQPLGRG